jgi:hypothetical protein
MCVCVWGVDRRLGAPSNPSPPAALPPRPAEGQIITLDQRDGAFHSLLLWLAYHQAKRQGLLGGRYLAEYAGLEAVIAPGGPPPSVPQRVWSWWFPG